MDLKKFEKVLDLVGGLLEVEGLAEATITPLLQKTYNEAIGKYRPVIRALPGVAEEVAQDIVPLLKVFVSLSNEVRSDEGFQEAVAEGHALKARMQMMALKVYMDAGFAREEAMDFLLKRESHNNFMQTIAKYANQGATIISNEQADGNQDAAIEG